MQKWIDGGASWPQIKAYGEYLAYRWEFNYSGYPIPSDLIDSSKMQLKYGK